VPKNEPKRAPRVFKIPFKNFNERKKGFIKIRSLIARCSLALQSSALLTGKFKKPACRQAGSLRSNSFACPDDIGELLTRSVHLKTGNKQWGFWKMILKVITFIVNTFSIRAFNS
jgi:hypothetical protein